jgi:hypothetical protein
MTSYSEGAAFDKDGNKVQEFKGGANHYENFLKAVRSRNREELNADIEEGHLSSALCHLGNISYRMGELLSIPEIAERLQGIESAENEMASYERLKEHLAHNKLDLEKVKLHYGPKLTFDPAAEKFIDNSQADAMLTREYRAPFVVPAAGAV